MWKVKYILGLLLLTAASCKKEYPDHPYKAIERFEIADASGATLKAVILEDNSIVIYWPPFQEAPDSVTPQIIVSDRASIQPASGEKVPFTEGLRYQVTAEDGSVQTYTFKPVINQPPLTIKNVSELRIGIDNFEISGEYFVADTGQTKLFLIDKTGREIQLPGADFQVFTSSRIYTNIPFSSAIDTGYYQVKLTSGLRTKLEGPYYMNKPYLARVSIPDAVTSIKRGKELTFSFSGPAAKYYRNSFGYASILVGNDLLRAEVKSQTDSTFSIHIPADAPAGAFEFMEIYDVKGDFIYNWERWGNPVTIE